MLPKIMRGGRRVSASLMQSEVLLSVRVEMKIITKHFHLRTGSLCHFKKGQLIHYL